MNMAAEPGQIFSFYSFKGGVGRSMALANVAALLARAGSSVLVVDWDLEAPGLQEYFNRFDSRIDGEVGKKPGIVDLLSDLRRGDQPNWRDTVINVSLRAKSGTVDFDFISAGRVGPDYSDRLQKINWQQLYDDLHLGKFLERLRLEWKQKYAYVLLDSRTGVTDIGDVCTVLLPDTLVAFFVTNEQNLDGVQHIIDRAHLVTQKLPIDRGKLVTLPVLARDEIYNEYKRAQEWRHRSAEKFAPVLKDWLPKSVTAASYFQKMFIPYVTHWSFGESLPVIENEEEIENPASISAAYSRLATLVKGGLDWGVIAAGENPLEVEALKVQNVRLEESIGGARRVALLISAAGIAIAFMGIAFAIYQNAASRSAVEAKARLTSVTEPAETQLEGVERKLAELTSILSIETAERSEALRKKAEADSTLRAAVADATARAEAADKRLVESNDELRRVQMQNSELLQRLERQLQETNQAKPLRGETLGGTRDK
jgi:cellulose biosynthesis protein BcsQ